MSKFGALYVHQIKMSTEVEFLGANGHSKKHTLPALGGACGDERYSIKSSCLSYASVHTGSSESICSGVQNTTG